MQTPWLKQVCWVQCLVLVLLGFLDPNFGYLDFFGFSSWICANMKWIGGEREKKSGGNK